MIFYFRKILTCHLWRGRGNKKNKMEKQKNFKTKNFFKNFN